MNKFFRVLLSIAFVAFISTGCLAVNNSKKTDLEKVSTKAENIKPKKIQTEKPQDLYRISKNQKYGFINKEGKVVVPMQYNELNPPEDFVNSDELIGLCKNKKCGYIDTSGKIVIPLVFDSVSSFSNGYAVVKKNGYSKLVDKSGKFLHTDKNYKEMYDYSEGLIGLCNEKCGYIDLSGKEVIPLKYIQTSVFKEGLSAVNIDGKWGYINKNDQMIIKPQFYKAYEFQDDLALVEYMDMASSDISGAYINKKGKVVIKIDYSPYKSFRSENLIVTQDCKYYDLKGKLVIDPIKLGFVVKRDMGYSVCPYFSEGLLIVEYGNEQYGYIDISGKLKLKVQANGDGDFLPIGPFSDGLADVCYNDKCGYIDKTGKYIIKPIFDITGLFNKGLAHVCIKETCGDIDKTGKFVWTQPKSDNIYGDY